MTTLGLAAPTHTPRSTPRAGSRLPAAPSLGMAATCLLTLLASAACHSDAARPPAAPTPLQPAVASQLGRQSTDPSDAPLSISLVTLATTPFECEFSVRNETDEPISVSSDSLYHAAFRVVLTNAAGNSYHLEIMKGLWFHRDDATYLAVTEIAPHQIVRLRARYAAELHSNSVPDRDTPHSLLSSTPTQWSVDTAVAGPVSREDWESHSMVRLRGHGTVTVVPTLPRRPEPADSAQAPPS